jgi:hypothetical protein
MCDEGAGIGASRAEPVERHFGSALGLHGQFQAIFQKLFSPDVNGPLRKWPFRPATQISFLEMPTHRKQGKADEVNSMAAKNLLRDRLSAIEIVVFGVRSSRRLSIT